MVSHNEAESCGHGVMRLWGMCRKLLRLRSDGIGEGRSCLDCQVLLYGLWLRRSFS